MQEAACAEFAISAPGLMAAMGFVEAWGAAAGVGLGTARALCVIVDEVVGNLMLHDASVGDGDRFTLRLERRPGAVAMAIADPGAAFDPLAWRETGPREVGGLGIALTRGLAREVTYARRDGRNELAVVVADAG